MSLVRVADPESPMVTLEEARMHCAVDAWGSPAVHPHDEMLQDFVRAATDELDGSAGWLGRALITQTWRLSLSHFPSGTGSAGAIELPLTSPTDSFAQPAPSTVMEVAYLDGEGQVTVIDPSQYRVVFEEDPQILEPVYGGSWPSVQPQRGAVRILYKAGYGAAASDVPGPIKSYIKARLGMLYAHRELVIAGTTIAPVPFMVNSLESYRKRVWNAGD